MKFQQLNQSWFKILFEKYKIDPKTNHATFSNNDNHYPIIDLSSIDFISFFDLINLFLTLDFFQDRINPTHVHFLGIGPMQSFKLIPISEYNHYQSSSHGIDSLSKYEISHSVYDLLSYLYHIGFFRACSIPKSAERIIFSGISENLLDQLLTYQGAGKNIIKLTPIYNANDFSEFRVEKSIRTLLNNLPPDINIHPIFSDGEFIRVFGYQLASNIIEHSNTISKNGLGAMGVIAMQLIENEKFAYLKNRYPKKMNSIFNSSNRAILEICIGDKGQGIVESLKDSFSQIIKALPYKAATLDDVIKFAFDEIGSRKSKSEKLGGVHALFRIIKSTAKYGGILRLVTHGKELIYNLSEFELKRTITNLGFEPNSINDYYHPYGTQLQILIPINLQNNNFKSVPTRTIKTAILPQPKLRKNIIPLSSLFKKDKIYDDLDSIKKIQALVDITNQLLNESKDILVVYDFNGRDWIEEEIALLLLSQKGVLHTKFCIGVNLPVGLPEILRKREMLSIEEVKKRITNDEDFFDVLSSKHRLFPAFDRNNSVSWLGLGRYQIDLFLSDFYFNSKYVIEEKDILTYFTTVSEQNICKLYLKNNPQLFYEIINNLKWQINLNPTFYLECIKSIININFTSILQSLGCILENGNYILPSSKNIADKFIQSTSLFQQNDYGWQVGKLFANEILSKLNDGENKILIITTTAPSELLSILISDSLSFKEVYLLNLGYFSFLNTEVIEASNEWKDIPTFIVTDVIDKTKTIEQIKTKLVRKGLNVRGILTLIEFVNESENDDIKVELLWKVITDKVNIPYPIFVFSTMKHPKNIDWIDLTEGDKSKLFLIDPFSLQEYFLNDLPKTDSNTIDKLLRLEAEGILREGHWVYESHHFTVTTCIQNLLLDSNISDEICQEIIDIIQKNNINLLLIPLHSHIRDIVPKIILHCKLYLGFSLEFFYCYSVKVLTKVPFYILPKTLQNRLENSTELSRILIIDDLIASGNTQETLNRAILRAAGKNKKKSIESIFLYAIIDRLGKARNKLWRSISKFSITNSTNISFTFRRWITLDIPVYDSLNCPLCKERQLLISICQLIKPLKQNSLLIELEKLLENYLPHSTESPLFINKTINTKKLPFEISIVGLSVNSVELAIWQINNLLFIGYPLIFLIDEFKKISTIIENLTSKESPEYNNLMFLQKKFLGQLVNNWGRLNSLSAEEKFKDIIYDEIHKGSDIIRHLLFQLGLYFTEIQNEESREIIKGIIITALRQLASLNLEIDVDRKQRENLSMGLSLFLVQYVNLIPTIGNIDQQHSDENRINEIKEQVYSLYIESKNVNVKADLLNIHSIITFSITSDFIYALILVLEHTIRPSRPLHKSHLKLLPSLLSDVNKGLLVFEENRRLLIDTINYFHSSLTILELTHPNLFNKEARTFLPIFKQQLEDFVNLFSDSKNFDENIPNRLLQKYSNLILITFPNQPESSIYNSLINTNINIKGFIEYIISLLGKLNVTLISKYEINEINDLTVLIPPDKYAKETILSFFDNYLKTPKHTINNPQVEISLISEINRYNTITLQLLTRFCTYEEANTHLAVTHGDNSINSSYLSLFGISCYTIPIKDEIYSARISLRFIKGFKIN